MSMPTPQGSSPASSLQDSSKARRVLACQQCQSRKIGCDRKFPCANCTKSHITCQPNTNPRQRRRRFAERELLDRLRHYERLLSSNGIEYEPLHSEPRNQQSTVVHMPLSERGRGPATTQNQQTSAVSTNVRRVCRSVDQETHASVAAEESDYSGEEGDTKPGLASTQRHDSIVKKAWDELFASNDNILFGHRKENIDLASLHPKEIHILKLWQIYLENVNPLLKVTHVSLQARIIDTMSNLSDVDPSLEALMFSIYCVAILSLEDEDCALSFGSSKEVLLNSYQFGCQQALLNAGIYRTTDRDCLTAFYLYLISIRKETDPRSLSSILGVAVRIAHRMDIHDEAANAKFPVFEAEMRRRLWWSLVVFDNRICEMANCKTAMLTPTWNCRSPLNVNDFELRPDMKTAPTAHTEPTEAVFIAVRSEIADFVRHSIAHLDYSNPSLRPLARPFGQNKTTSSSELSVLEKTIEDKCLKICDPEDPLHYMTIWTARSSIGKNYLLEHYLKNSHWSFSDSTGNDHNHVAVKHMLNMLECDTKLMTSPLTTGYRWYIHPNYPLPAVMFLSQALKRWPTAPFAEATWRVINENYEARLPVMQRVNAGVHKIFLRGVVQAWEARQDLLRQRNIATEPDPMIVTDIKRRCRLLEQSGKQNAAHSDTQHHDKSKIGDDPELFVPSVFDAFTIPSEGFGSMPNGTQSFEDGDPTGVEAFGMIDFDWTMVDWNGIANMT